MDNDQNNLETVSTSQPLYSIVGDIDTQRQVSYKHGTKHSIVDVSLEQESLLDYDLRRVQAESELCSANILASGKLFRLLTKATGLWNPRKKRYALLCGLFALLNVLSLLAEIIIPSICGPFVDRCVTSFNKSVTNVTSQSTVGPFVTEVHEVNLGFSAWNAFSDTMTCVLLIYTLWRVEEHLPSLSLASIEAKVSSREWLLINTMFILCSISIIIATGIRISVVEYRKMKFYGTFGLGVLIAYFTAFICCCVFAVGSCALGSLVEACFQDLCNMGEGTLNDVTDLHQKLCKQLSIASQSFKLWFLVHWLMSASYCLMVFVFDSLHFPQLGWAPSAFMVTTFILNIGMFLVPCVYASRVTWKCNDLLSKINSMSSRDWDEGHPFRERSTVNQFIYYAERSRCGFKIGSVTFGSSGTWISVFLSILGLSARLYGYIK